MPNQANNEVREDRRIRGRVVRLNKGFGFIEGEDGRDYFFHWSELSKFSKHFRNLVAGPNGTGDQVTFQPGKTDDGPRAFAIETVES